MSRTKWETVVAPSASKYSQPGLRRVVVPGGYLYQVEHHVEVSDGGAIDWVEWFPPVFVPFDGDGE